MQTWPPPQVYQHHPDRRAVSMYWFTDFPKTLKLTPLWQGLLSINHDRFDIEADRTRPRPRRQTYVWHTVRYRMQSREEHHKSMYTVFHFIVSDEQLTFDSIHLYREISSHVLAGITSWNSELACSTHMHISGHVSSSTILDWMRIGVSLMEKVSSESGRNYLHWLEL